MTATSPRRSRSCHAPADARAPAAAGAGRARRARGRRPRLRLLVRRAAGRCTDLDLRRSRARRSRRIIGPSGCGKSTFLRSINRLNDLIPGVRHQGDILLDGTSVFAPGTDLVALRQRVGMVFQRPNPFPKSIFDNVAVRARAQPAGDRARPARPGRALPPAGGAVGRGEGPAGGAGRPGCRAASSSGSASRGRSATSPRCC